MGGRCRNWTPGEVRELRALFATGMKYASIGRRLGRTRPAVRDALRRLGLGWGERRSELRKAVRSLRLRGRDDYEIADLLGVLPRTVGNVRRAMKLPPVNDRVSVSRMGGKACAAIRSRLSGRLLRAIRVSAIPVQTPDLIVICVAGKSHPRSRVWAELRLMERAGLVQRVRHQWCDDTERWVTAWKGTW